MKGTIEGERHKFMKKNVYVVTKESAFIVIR